ncbi:hypothetical protein ODJ79_09855 [Actinoplanes sp. KI2]|uniref:hypothetical protein n=1 Tax=Actinoplanes sp. KI2 TaxID=2983315 RepID=UPI0021D56C74|nr:hypothetical protein [Actinoplanes sp. KI2]MCU7724018.1 hypothetical protein [Actinoplanes sp. KI2]
MSGWRALRGRRPLSLAAALLISGALLAAPSKGQTQAPPPLTAAQAWPHAVRSTLPAALADGTAYEPVLFLDAQTSVGTAPSRDGKSVRLVLRRSDGTVRQLRSVAAKLGPSFSTAAVAGNLLVWVAGTTRSQELWSVDLRTGAAPRRLTADLGDARFYQSQDDLVIADGRVHWVAAGPGDFTELRSVALAGGPVEVRDQPGTWALSAWPWILDGVTAAGGTTQLLNLVTGQTLTAPSSSRGVTACSPAWCRLVSLTKNGDSRIEVMHPDGSARRTAAEGTAATVIADPVVLDRFEVLSQQTGTSDLTGDIQLLAYDVRTRTLIEVSPDAFAVSYRAGILWWSTGTQDSYVRHALDLRTA